MTLLQVSGISKSNENGPIVSNVSFLQKKLQRMVIAGETGSGKSTLLKLIAGLEQADSGEIHFLNKRIEGADEKLVAGHPQIAYLSQYFELPKFLRVEQVLTYANHLTLSAAEEIFDVCSIKHLLKRKTDQLSGGERQRIGMARALIGAPKLLLLDEPYSNLDVIHKNILKDVIRKIGDKLKITCMLVSHDPNDTLSWADEIIVLKDGEIVQQGTPHEIYGSPVNQYVAGLFGKYNLISVENKELFKLVGVSKKDQKAMVRPEQIKIGAKGSNSVKGKVIKSIFFGSHYELHILINKTEVIVRILKSDVLENETVFLTLPKKAHILND